MNTLPYTNARRTGRTHPDMVELIAPSDPRASGPQYVSNRASRRASGQRRPIGEGTRRNPISRGYRRYLARFGL